MLIDKLSTYSDKQEIRDVGSTVSTNLLDEGVDHDIGVGREIFLAVGVDSEAFVGAGSVRVHLETSNDQAWSSSKRLMSSENKDAATMNSEGVFVKMRMPSGLQRYTRLVFEVTGAAFTAGKVFAGLVLSVDHVRSYPDRLSISGRP